jgi:hypothetical protein
MTTRAKRRRTPTVPNTPPLRPVAELLGVSATTFIALCV